MYKSFERKNIKNTIDRNSNFSYLFQGKQGIPYYWYKKQKYQKYIDDVGFLLKKQIRKRTENVTINEENTDNTQKESIVQENGYENNRKHLTR